MSHPKGGEGGFNYAVAALSKVLAVLTMYGKHFYGMGGPTYDITRPDNPYMDMECLISLDDAVEALHGQLNTPSRHFAALISSWYWDNRLIY